MLGQASGAGTDHMIPETVVVGVAGPRRGREGVHRHEDSTARDSTTSEKPNDTKAVEVAYRKVLNVCAHSSEKENPRVTGGLGSAKRGTRTPMAVNR